MTYEQKIAKEKEQMRQGMAPFAGFMLGYLVMYFINQIIRWLPDNPGTRELMDIGVGLIGAVLVYCWSRWGHERFVTWRFRRAARKMNKRFYHG